MTDAYRYTGEEGKAELRVVSSLISDENVTVQDTIKELTNLTLAPQTYSRQFGDHCYYTAVALLETAAGTEPERQSKLIDFLHKLKDTVVINPATSKPFTHDDQEVWSGLPTFGYTFADELNSIPSPNATPDKKRKWENTVSYFAQLDASTQDPDLNFTQSWATAYISAALEDTPRPGQEEIALRLACIWYIYDSEKLWSKISPDGDFTPEKWQRWKQGLENVSRDSLEDSTKALIDKALSEINRAESR